MAAPFALGSHENDFRRKCNLGFILFLLGIFGLLQYAQQITPVLDRVVPQQGSPPYHTLVSSGIVVFPRRGLDAVVFLDESLGVDLLSVFPGGTDGP